MLSIHTRKYSASKKENSDTSYNLNEPEDHMVSEKSQVQNTNTVRFHLPWVLREVMPTERMVAARGGGEEGMGVTV